MSYISWLSSLPHCLHCHHFCASVKCRCKERLLSFFRISILSLKISLSCIIRFLRWHYYLISSLRPFPLIRSYHNPFLKLRPCTYPLPPPSPSSIFPSHFLYISLSFSLPLLVFLPEHAPVLSISLMRARAPFFPRHFTPSFSLHSLTIFPPLFRCSSLSSLVALPLPSRILTAHSERFPPPIPLARAVSLSLLHSFIA